MPNIAKLIGATYKPNKIGTAVRRIRVIQLTRPVVNIHRMHYWNYSADEYYGVYYSVVNVTLDGQIKECFTMGYKEKLRHFLLNYHPAPLPSFTFKPTIHR